MLKGILDYFDPVLNRAVRYAVIGQASLETIKLYLEPNGNFEDCKAVYDGKYEDPWSGDDNRRLDIKVSNKYKSNCLNRDFASKVAAAVRYCMSVGKLIQKDELNIEYNPVSNYIVEKYGSFSCEYGVVIKLDVRMPYVNLQLNTYEDSVILSGDYKEAVLFKELKEKDKYGRILSQTKIENVGFKFCKDTLGIEYIPPVKSMERASVLGMYDNIEDVIRNNPDKNTKWILDRHYVIVSDDMLDELFEMFMNHKGYIAFDTETSGLKITFKSRTGEHDQLVGCVLSLKKGTGYYFPLQHKRFDNLCNGDHAYFMEKFMRPILEQKDIICHNTSFDWKVAHIYEINMNVVFDTMLAFGVTKRYEYEEYSIGLKELVKNLLGLDMFELSDFVIGVDWKNSNVRFWDLPYELVRRYAPADADMTLSLYEFIVQNDMIAQYNAEQVLNLEIEFAKVVAYSEFYGYHINIDGIPKLRETLETSMNTNEKLMYTIAGREFNPNSPPQLMKIMYDELGIRQIGETRSTKKEILKQLVEETNLDGEPRYPFVVALSNYRLDATLYKNFLKRLNDFMTPDGFIFPKVNQLGTETGRVSINDPNYQSYNDAVRKFVTPRKGFIHCDSDFSQIEQRVLASEAKQETLMEAMNDPDTDYHTYQAARMFGLEEAEVTKVLRSQSKGINFGLPYGMGDSSLGLRIFGERTKDTQMKAGRLRKKFFEGQEKIEEFFERIRDGGVRNGYTETLMKRRRYYHKGKFSEAEIRRQAGNHVIQGSAADIYKIAVVRMFQSICKEGWLGRVLFNVFVHDETLFEVSETIDLYDFLRIWKEEYETKIDGYCKLFAGIGFGTCWYNAKSDELAVQYVEQVINEHDYSKPFTMTGIDFINKLYNDHDVYRYNRVATHLVSEEAQGKVLKTIINATLIGVTTEYIENDLKAISNGELKVENSKLLTLLQSEYKGVLKQLSVGMIGKDLGNGVKAKVKDYYSVKKLVLHDWIHIFCRGIDDIDDSTLNILAASSNVRTDIDQTNTYVVSLDDDDYVEMSPQEFIYSTVNSFGVYLDIQNKVCYMKMYNNAVFLDNLKRGVCREAGVYTLKFVNFDTVDKIPVQYSTKYFVDGSDVPHIQMLLNTVRG